MTGCCGAYEIYEFENIDSYDGENFKEQRANARTALMTEISNVPSGKLMMITLIDSQLQDGWLSIVRELGFRRIARWINSNHGNVCNLYVKENNCTPAPKYKGRNK